MGLGKTYSTKYLLDSNNSSGVAGQVLSTTSTGIDWVDANTVPGTGLWLANGNDIYNSNSGNVGIGTTGPGTKLDVRGSGYFLGTATSGAALVTIENNSGSTATSYGLLVIGGGNSSNGKTFEVRDASGNVDLIVKGDGKVGIGTPTPTEKLVVQDGKVLAGHTNTKGYGFHDLSNFAYTANTSRLSLVSNGAEAVSIDSSQKVGIGTTSPTTFLQVSGQGNRAGGNIQMGLSSQGADKWSYLTGTHYNSTSEPEGFALIGGYSDVDENRVVIGGDIWETNPATSIHFWTHSSSTHAQGGSEKMRITSAGDVQARRPRSNTAGEVALSLQPTDSTIHYGFRIDAATNSFNLDRVGTGNFLTINPTGNVGIGTTSPQGKLHVKSASAGSFTYDTTADDLIVESNANGGMTIATAAANTSRIIFASPDDATGSEISFNQASTLMKLGTTTGSGILALQSGNASEAMRITSAGDIGIGKTTSLQSHRLSILKGASNQQLGLYYDETHLTAIGTKSTGDLQVYAWNGSSYRNILLGVDGGAAGGSVGIGTITPGTINGVAFSSVGLHTKYSTLGRTITEGTSWGEYIMNHSGASANNRAKFIQSKDGNIFLGSYDDNGSQRVHVTVKNSGTVGIGTTLPGGKLDVDGNNFNTATTTRMFITDHGNNYNNQDLAATLTFRSRYWSGDDNTGASVSNIKHYKGGSNGNGGSDLAFETATTGGVQTEKLRIGAAGAIKFNAYNGTNNTGSPTHILGTDANGLIVKSTAGSSIGPWLPLAAGSGDPLTGDLYINKSAPALRLNDSSSNKPYELRVDAETFSIKEVSNSRTLMSMTTGAVITLDSLGSNTVINTTGAMVVPNGKVGIGTTSAGRPLTINSDTAHKAIRILENDSANESWDIGVDVDGDLNFFNSADTSPSVTFLDNGNVGIGNTNPQNTLHLGDNTSSSAGTLRIDSFAANQFWKLEPGTNTLNIKDYDGTSLASFDGAGNYVLFNGGNVGIGTTGPGAKLTVQEDSASAIPLKIWNGNGTANRYSEIQFSRNNNDGKAGIRGYAIDLSVDHKSQLRFYTSAAADSPIERMTINQSGNVGIGTTFPTGKLEIQKSQVTTQFDRDCFLRLHPSATTNSGGYTNMIFGTSTTNNYGVAVGGRKAGTGDTSSDNNPEFSVRILNDSITGTEVLNINTTGAVKFPTYGAGTLVTDANGNITAATSGVGTGTVTSITKGAGLVVAGSPITTTGSVAVEYAANAQNIITGGNNFIGDTVVSTDQILITNPGVTTTNRRVGRVEVGDLPFLPLAGGTMTGAIIIPEYIAHAGDTDTKFGFTAANQFQVIAGGNTNLNVQGNGVDLSYAGSTRLTTQTGGIAITGDLTVTTDVGIGLTNPDVPLHVTANEDGSGIDKGTAKFINTNTGQGATTMHMVQTSSSNFANAVKFWQGSTPTAVGFIRLTTSATQFITSASDLNLKKNITNWSDDTLSKFKALEPKKFRFKTQDVSEDKTLGFIAQNEVDNFPEAYPQFLGEDEKPYYGFNPTGMVPHLMKAVKDLVEKVEILENKITQLENNN